MDAGFFRGTSVDQDGRFSDKEKKLMKTLIFEPILSTKVNMTKVNFNTIKPWISKKICEILGFEDEVVIQYIYELLETDKSPNPQKMQMQIAAFLQAYNARIFMKELWTLLVSAQNNSSGIPDIFIKQKKDELLRLQAQQGDREVSVEDIQAISNRVAKMVPQVKTTNPSDSPPTPKHNTLRSKLLLNIDNNNNSSNGGDDDENEVSESKTVNVDQSNEAKLNGDKAPQLKPKQEERSRSSSSSSSRSSTESGSDDYKRRRRRRRERSSSSPQNRRSSSSSKSDRSVSDDYRRKSSQNRKKSPIRRRSSSNSRSSERKPRHIRRRDKRSSDSPSSRDRSHHRSRVAFRRNVSNDRRPYHNGRRNIDSRHRRRPSRSHSSDSGDRYRRNDRRDVTSHARRSRNNDTRRYRDTRRVSPAKWTRRRLSSSGDRKRHSRAPSRDRHNTNKYENSRSRKRHRSASSEGHASNMKRGKPSRTGEPNRYSSSKNKHKTITPPHDRQPYNSPKTSVSLDSESILRQKAIESMMKKVREQRFSQNQETQDKSGQNQTSGSAECKDTNEC